MATFIDDDGKPVNATTAEQHALDHPGHSVSVLSMGKRVGDEFTILTINCTGCTWWNEDGYK